MPRDLKRFVDPGIDAAAGYVLRHIPATEGLSRGTPDQIAEEILASLAGHSGRDRPHWHRDLALRFPDLAESTEQRELFRAQLVERLRRAGLTEAPTVQTEPGRARSFWPWAVAASFALVAGVAGLWRLQIAAERDELALAVADQRAATDQALEASVRESDARDRAETLAEQIAADLRGANERLDKLSRELAQLKRLRTDGRLLTLRRKALRSADPGGAPAHAPSGVPLTLILNPSVDEPFNDYRIEFVDSSGRAVWNRDGLRPDEGGSFLLDVPPDTLPRSRYEVLVLGRRGDLHTPVESFDLVVGQARPLPTANRAAQAAEEPPREVLSPLTDQIGRGEIDTHLIPAAAGRFYRLVVEQDGVDVALRLVAPDGEEVARRDTPNGRVGPESLSFVARMDGTHTLEITSGERAEPGTYRLTVEERLRPTPGDEKRIAAETIFSDGTFLRAKARTGDDYRAVLAKYREAVPLWRELGDAYYEASTWFAIGYCHFRLSEPRLALTPFENSARLRRELGNIADLGRSLTSVGWANEALGEFEKALAAFEEALPLRRLVGDKKGEGIVLNNLGAMSLAMGDIEQAEQYLGQALALRGEIGDRLGVAVALSNLGKTYTTAGDLERAVEQFERSLAIFEERRDPLRQGVTESLLANALSRLGRDSDALMRYQRALASLRVAGSERQQAFIHNNLGLLHSREGNHAVALAETARAEEIFSATEDPRGLAQVATSRGEIYLALGEAERARGAFAEALARWLELAFPIGEARALFGLARAERGSGESEAARRSIVAALDVLESVRQGLANRQLRSAFSDARWDYYQFYIDLLMELHRQEPEAGHATTALGVSETWRARSLLEVLSEAQVDLKQDADASLLAEERSLRRRLNGREQFRLDLLDKGAEAVEIAGVAREIADLADQLERIDARIRLESPRYAELARPQPAPLLAIQSQLVDQDSVLLEYSLGESRSFLWVVTETALITYELPGRETIEIAARRLYELILTGRDGLARAAAESEAKRLSEMILGPAREQLAGRSRLLVVPDGMLHYLPFAALPAPRGGSLIDHHEVVHLPSATAILSIRERRRDRPPAPLPLAVLADPVFHRDDSRLHGGEPPAAPSPGASAALPADLARAGRDLGVDRFDRLPHTRTEAAAIAAVASAGRPFVALDFNADRETALSGALADHRIVHLASHALLNTRRPALSGIVLSLVDEEGQPRNGFMRLLDIYDLELNADLVVLSACQTALGRDVRGEGLVGLTQGFFHAGSRAVLASLWNVDDPATAQLMKHFYRALLVDEVPTAAALRVAQRALRADPRYRDPFYWAGFVLQGDLARATDSEE